jgi:[acyl-carrier-protein] S-malonyltransferase
MGLSFAETSPAAAAVFSAANEALQFDLRGLISQGPAETLALTAHTQPAVLTASIATWSAATEAGLPPADFVAGHSLGEYSALVAAGALSIADAVCIVRARGRFMQEAVPVGHGAMAAVLMLDLAKVSEACSDVCAAHPDWVVVPANINGADQIVIAGHAAAVQEAGAKCLEFGARRVIPLDVSAPFHSPLMAPVRDRLASEMKRAPVRDASIPLVTNVEARPETNGARLRALLLDQVTAPVRWTDVVDRLLQEGCDTFIELGPGAVLTGLVRRQARHVRVISISDPEKLAAARQALAA